MHIRIAAFGLVVAALSAASARAADMQIKHFGKTSDDQQVDQVTLTNDSGASVKLLTFGARIIELKVPDKGGAMGDVVLGFENMKAYETDGPYFGPVIGRYANRIAKGQFMLDGTKYAVPINNGANALHGGFKGYDKRIWKAETAMMDGPSARFTLVDADGEEGYPGTVKVTVIYTLTNANTLRIQYYATTDKATVINLTSHDYFNLKDGGASTVLSHVVKLYADQYTPVDAGLIPTGTVSPVKGTAFDFTAGKEINADFGQMNVEGGAKPGYDNNFVLNNRKGDFAKAAEVFEPTTGRLMTVFTTEPGIQFYSGTRLSGAKGKGGNVYDAYKGFALEAQHFPDSPNHPDFPSTTLKPGETYRQVTEYRFSIATQLP